jgi:hypothetical protein
MVKDLTNYIGASEAARIARCSEANLYQLRTAGKLPGTLCVAGRHVFLRREIEAYAKERAERIARRGTPATAGATT